MKNFYPVIVLVGVLFSYTATAQTYSQSFIACGKSYVSILESTGENAIKVIIKDGVHQSVKKEFQIITNDFETFAKIFKGSFQKIDSLECDQAELDKVLSYARKLYFTFKASEIGEAPDPEAGLFRAKDSVYIYTKRADSTNYMQSAQKYKVIRAQVEIKDGYLENIKVYVEIEKKIFVFNNSFGIGFSSITNFNTINDIFLYERYSLPIKKKTTRNYFYITLGELIDFDYNLALDRRDYSPQNAHFSIKGGESVTLFKEATKRLFEAHIYTDFVGLNEDKPNGLVQTEISKKININTVQLQSNSIFYRIFKSFGFGQYITPSITISKLEQHNKRLLLGDLDSIRNNPGITDTSRLGRSRNRYTTPLELYQYQHFSTGFTANLLFFSNHDLKYNFYINAGLRLGMTQVTDSLTTVSGTVISKTGQVNEYTVNNLQIFPELILTLLPEERFNFTLSQKFMYIKAFSNNLELISYDRKDRTNVLVRGNQWLSVSELLMSIQVNPNSKLFGRARLNADLNNFQNNFAQIQLGYSVYILGGAKSEKKQESVAVF
jgi:hypothetical protein